MMRRATATVELTGQLMAWPRKLHKTCALGQLGNIIEILGSDQTAALTFAAIFFSCLLCLFSILFNFDVFEISHDCISIT